MHEPHQLTLDDLLTDALERVERNTDAEWRTAAEAAVLTVCNTHPTFTSGHVLAELALSDVTTHDLRALGPVMLWAQREGYARPTDRYVRNTTQPNHHGNPDRVWCSNLYVGGAL